MRLGMLKKQDVEDNQEKVLMAKMIECECLIDGMQTKYLSNRLIDKCVFNHSM